MATPRSPRGASGPEEPERSESARGEVSSDLGRYLGLGLQFAATVTLSAADPAPGTGVTDMRLSNDGTTFSAYIPFATTTSWTLTPGDGVKTVYAQFRDAVGNESDVVSDDIELQAPIAPADATSPGAKKLRPAPGARGERGGSERR